MPEVPTMPVGQLIWIALIFLFGTFFMALSKALSSWMQERWFKVRKPNPNGDGGVTHQQAEAMIKTLTDNGSKLEKGLEAINKSQEETAKVILATDEDGVHKVHNKPSVERTIRSIWDKVKNIGGAT